MKAVLLLFKFYFFHQICRSLPDFRGIYKKLLLTILLRYLIVSVTNALSLLNFESVLKLHQRRAGNLVSLNPSLSRDSKS